jgi:hypothetical protein
MNATRNIFLAFIFTGIAALTASAQPATNAPTAVVTNTIQISTFDSNDTTGKDPFFPRSGRRIAAASAASPNTSQAVSLLALQGFSGSAKRRFAIINGHTFMVGEETEINTAAGRFRIRCEEIADDKATVSVGGTGQRIELRMPNH